jgi:hypothetical protein
VFKAKLVQESIQTHAQSLHSSQTKVEQLQSELEDLKESGEAQKAQANKQIQLLKEENIQMKKQFSGPSTILNLVFT